MTRLRADSPSFGRYSGDYATAMGALAYTQGTDLHFVPGQYQRASQSGQQLIGHALAHVVQQSQGRAAATTQAKVRCELAVAAVLLARCSEDQGGTHVGQPDRFEQLPLPVRLPPATSVSCSVVSTRTVSCLSTRRGLERIG